MTKKLFVRTPLAAVALLAASLTLPVMATTRTVDPANVDVPNNVFATIGAAVTAADPGDTIEIVFGTYDEAVVVNKSLTIRGIPNGSGDLPTITRTTGSNQQLIRLNGISAPAINVVVESLRFELPDSIANVGVAKLDSSGPVNTLTVRDSEFVKIGASTVNIPNSTLNTTSAAIAAFDVRGSVGIPGVVLQGNTLEGPFQRGLFLRGSNGVIGGSNAGEGNTITGTSQGALVQFITSGDIVIEGNTFQGTFDQLDITEPNAPHSVTVTGNTFEPGSFRAIHLKNFYSGSQANPVNTLVSENIINTNFYGVTVSNARKVTLDNNTFIANPTTNSAAGARAWHVEVNNKVYTNASGDTVPALEPVPLDLIVIRNTFGAPADPTAIGVTALTFRHHNTNPAQLDSFFILDDTVVPPVPIPPVIGDADLFLGNNANIFEEGLDFFIELDPSSGNSTASPFYIGLLNNTTSNTTMVPFFDDIVLLYNVVTLDGVTYDDLRVVDADPALTALLFERFFENGDNNALGEVTLELQVPSNVNDWMMLAD